MASNDVFTTLTPKDLLPSNGIPQDYAKLRSAGLVQGFPLRRLTGDGAYFRVKVPVNGTPVSTGLTVKVRLIEDPSNATLGGVYRLGLSGAKIVSGTTNIGTGSTGGVSGAVAMGTETTANYTSNATQGVETEVSFAITTANLNTPAAGNSVLLYLRRIADSNDTAVNGECLVTAIDVLDT